MSPKQILTAALVGLGALAVTVAAPRFLTTRSGASGEPSPTEQHVGIIPFVAATPAHQRLADAIAESLAVRLGKLPSLSAHVDRDNTASADQLSVRGDIAQQDGRLIIAARLFGHSSRDTLWTATFWRRDSLTSELVGDLAEGLAGAIYGRLVRSNRTDKREKTR